MTDRTAYNRAQKSAARARARTAEQTATADTFADRIADKFADTYADKIADRIVSAVVDQLSAIASLADSEAVRGQNLSAASTQAENPQGFSVLGGVLAATADTKTRTPNADTTRTPNADTTRTAGMAAHPSNPWHVEPLTDEERAGGKANARAIGEALRGKRQG